MTEALFASFAPVFRVDGTASAELGRDVLRVEIEERTDGLRTLELELLAIPPAASDSDDMMYLDGKLLNFGKSIQVVLGSEDNQTVVFVGPISRLGARLDAPHPAIVSLSAEDKLMKLRLTRRCRTYEDMTDADIASAIASAHGLGADVAVDGPRYDVVQQLDQSDLAFLRERAERLQAEIWVAGTTLHFKTRDRRPRRELTLVAGNQLLAVDVSADLAHQRSSVRVSGYDAANREALDESEDGAAVRREITGGRTGSTILERTFGACASHRTRDVPLAGGEARAWARAEILRRARRFVVATGTTRGTPEMAVGTSLRLDGIGAPFRGEGYYVTRVRHTFDRVHGMRTHFEAERPTVNEVS